MGRATKVVLAYSGGVDTSVCIPYLKQEWGVEEVITFAADLDLRKRANCGLGPTAGRLERAEVMFTEQRLRGLTHLV